MARVLFSETSRRWANQLNDLRERWMLRREEPTAYSVKTVLFEKDIRGLDRDLLARLKVDLLDLLATSKTELDRAKGRVWEKGVYMERDAYNDLSYTVRSIGNHIQKVNHELGKQRRDRAKERNFEQHFMDVCREMLPKELFVEIMKETRDRAGLESTDRSDRGGTG